VRLAPGGLAAGRMRRRPARQQGRGAADPGRGCQRPHRDRRGGPEARRLPGGLRSLRACRHGCRGRSASPPRHAGGDGLRASARRLRCGGPLEPPASSPETLTLLGELALAAYDGERAQGYAQQALQRDPKDPAALRVLARAYVVRGDAPQAVATAREAKAHDATRGGFELAEVLASLDRNEEAHQELEHLRSGGAPTAEVDRR